MIKNTYKPCFYSIYFLCLFQFFCSSCESDLDKINENPNFSETVSPQLLLTAVSAHAFKVSELAPMYASRMVIGIGEENTFQYYKWSNGTMSNYNQLMQLQKMTEEAEKINNANYKALALFLKSVYFFDLTLRFGDIPFSDALKAETHQMFHPKYDSQEQVFEGILSYLQEANELINTSDVILGDIIFQGDVLQWKKLINAFRLKVLITLSNKDRVGGFEVASTFRTIFELEELMLSDKDNGSLVFYDATSSRYSQFNNSSYGSSLYMSSFIVEQLQQCEDPRLFVFAQPTASALERNESLTAFSSYNGGNPISQYAANALLVADKNISKVQSRYYLDPINEPHSLLGFSEQQFILSEAVLRGWIPGDAVTYYESGIVNSFKFYQDNPLVSSALFDGFNPSEYLEHNKVKLSVSDSFENNLEKIILQKYLTLFHQGSWTSYFEYLRTSFPNWPIDAASPALKRWRYPLSEYNNNISNLQEALNRQFGGSDSVIEATWWLK